MKSMSQYLKKGSVKSNLQSIHFIILKGSIVKVTHLYTRFLLELESVDFVSSMFYVPRFATIHTTKRALHL